MITTGQACRFCLCASALCLAGCDATKTYTVQVDAISAPVGAETDRPGKPAQSYHVRTPNPKLDESSLRYKEVADYVRTALSGRGMYEAPTPEKADVVIDIDYGMDAPRIKFEKISDPIIRQTSSETRTIVEKVTARDPITGVMIQIDQVVSVTTPGSTEMIGMKESIQPVIIYEKYLKLSARANQETVEGRPPPEIWSVNVSADDASQELRKYLPILASATADYIGSNTKESKPVKINESDEVVTFIKKGM